MAGIGEASAILSVAQIGLQLAQTLVTIIGDYRDAATNINRLRDEVHLTSICLQQLGDLANENRLLAGRGVLEATNLRERCRAVIWEIRTIIKKGDNPLHPDEISKDEIDVSYFMAWKWALWTKKKLDDPRQELDRLKDSMTLTFVTHMALLASSEHERLAYTSQIPGIKRNVNWAEEKYRETESPPLEDPIPYEVLEAGPNEWREFLEYKARREQQDLDDTAKVDLESFRTRLEAAGVPSNQINAVLNTPGATTLVPPETNPKVEYQAWSLDPFVGRVKLPVTEAWLQDEISKGAQSSETMWKVHSKLQPWYKKEVDGLIRDLNADMQFGWSFLSLNTIRRHAFFHRGENPPSLQVIVKGEASKRKVYPILRMQRPEMISIEPEERTYVDVIPYSTKTDLGERILEVEKPKALTDEELIHEQLSLYTPANPV